VVTCRELVLVTALSISVWQLCSVQDGFRLGVSRCYLEHSVLPCARKCVCVSARVRVCVCACSCTCICADEIPSHIGTVRWPAPFETDIG
jgi:hypothetical protein